MGTNFIDFDTTGVTPATNDTVSSAISPVVDGDPAVAATFNRPTELLRKRTETLRTEADYQKYLADADRGFVVSGGGTVSWGGATDVSAGTGVFSITSPITVRPFLSPVSSVRASCVVDGPGADTLTLAFSSSGPHAYEGGNNFSIKFALGTFGVAVTGTPANDIVVTFPSGTTTAALVALLNGVTGFITLAGTAPALAYLVASGAGVGNITSLNDTPGANTYPLSAQKILGALDAERHVIGVTAVSDYCTAFPLRQGDVVAVWYNALVDGAGGGRMESLPDYGAGAGTDKTGVVVGDLFNLRTFPERAPYAVPLCTVVDDNLVFLNQVSVVRGQPQTGLSAGFVQRAGDTMTGKLSVTPATIAGSGEAVRITMPSGGMTAAEIALVLKAYGATGVVIEKPSGAGNALRIENAGTSEALLITNTSVNSALSVTQTTASTAALVNIASSAAGTLLQVRTTHASGQALDIRGTGSVAAPGFPTTAYFEGRHTDDVMFWMKGPSTPSTNGCATLVVQAPSGDGITPTYALSIGAPEANAYGVRVQANNAGTAFTVVGRYSATWTGTGGTVLLTAGGAQSNQLTLVSSSSTAPTTPDDGAFLAHNYTPGTGGASLGASRLRMGVGNVGSGANTWSGIRRTITSAGAWSTSTLYHWVDLEGVCHVRGTLTVSGSPNLANAASVTLGTLPVGSRPLQDVFGTVLFLITGGVSSALYLWIDTSGVLTLWNESGGTITGLASGYGVSFDYPLFA